MNILRRILKGYSYNKYNYTFVENLVYTLLKLTFKNGNQKLGFVKHLHLGEGKKLGLVQNKKDICQESCCIEENRRIFHVIKA